MKKITAVSLTLCLAVSALLYGCVGKNRTDAENGTNPAAPSASERETAEYEIKNSIEEMTRLAETAKNRILVKNQEELDSALDDKTASGVLFASDEHISVTVGGKHDGKTVTVNAPSGSVVSESENVSFVLEATGSGGLITDAKAASVYVKGENIPLTLKAGAAAVFVSGKNCDVTFKGGEYPSVTVLNSATVLTNLTETDITLTFANGTHTVLPAGEKYSVADDVFSKAKA